VLGGVAIAAGMLIALGPRLEWDMRGAGLAFVTRVLGVVRALGYLFAVLRGPVTLITTLTALYPILTLLLA
jgi:transporter family protein